MMLQIACRVVCFFMRFWHPVFRVRGRAHITPGQNYLICVNHRGMADPLWVLFALNLPQLPRIMAKDSLMRVPVLGAFLKAVGVFGIKRGENDISAIKESLATLKAGKSLMIFPEGTRVRPGTTVQPKPGAVMLAMRTGTPVLPVYIETRRRPWSTMRCCIGAPYLPHAEDPRKATAEELQRETQVLMEKIYAMGAET